MKEADIQTAIPDYRFSGETAAAPSTLSAAASIGSGRLVRRTSSDDLDGKFVGLEVKTAKGKLSADQIQFDERLLAIGVRYHVVRPIDDVMALACNLI